jgi:hypothetical protein
MHTFLHFVVSLQSIFYTLGLIFVFDVNIYSYSLKLFKIDPVVSLLPATIRQWQLLDSILQNKVSVFISIFKIIKIS